MVVGALQSQVAKVSLISYYSVLNRYFGVGLKGFTPLENFIQKAYTICMVMFCYGYVLFLHPCSLSSSFFFSDLNIQIIIKPGKPQRSKQRCQDLCWKVHGRAQSFALRSCTMYEFVSSSVRGCVLSTVKTKRATKNMQKTMFRVSEPYSSVNYA